MKKWFARVNRGILLLFIAVIAVSIFLIYVEVQNQKQKKILLSKTYDYITAYGKALSSDGEIDSIELSSYDYDVYAFTLALSEKGFSNISSYYYDNQILKDEAVSILQNEYMLKLDNGGFIISCSQVPSSRKPQISIYKNSATVSIGVNRVTELVDERGRRYSESSDYNYEIEYIYKDGTWSIISAYCYIY